MNNGEFGKFLSQLRKEKGLTQLQLAEKLNVSDKAISRWETGKNYPDIEIFEDLSKILDVSISELLEGKKIEEGNLSTVSEEEIVNKIQNNKKSIENHKMKKINNFIKKNIFIIVGVFIGSISILLVSLYVLIPGHFEKQYEEEKSVETLYKLCDYVYTFHNSDLILKYYPTLIFETDYEEYSWEYEKDNMLTKLLQTSLNDASYDVFVEYLSKSYNIYSTTKFAEICIIDFINGYYEIYGDLKNTYNLYEVIIDTCPDVVGKFTFCQEYTEFVNLYTDDTEKFEEINNWKKDLAEQVKSLWENEGKIS